VIAVEIAGLGKSVEQKHPNVATSRAVMTNVRISCKTVNGATPPKKNIKLKSGIDAAISKSEKLRPAKSFPVTIEKAERREHMSISYVLRSFSPLIAVAVNAGVIKRMRRIWTAVSR